MPIVGQHLIGARTTKATRALFTLAKPIQQRIGPPQPVTAKDSSMSQKTEQNVQIGELAKRLNITTRTIRYYEEIGLMGPTERLGGGTRTYNREDILRLKFILKLKQLGISLKDIQELSEIFDINAQNFDTITPKLIEILDQHINTVDEKMASLSSLRLDIVEYRKRITDLLNKK
jgi:MerR family transcriptional regulator, repressor of the yfmOP operon